MQSSDELRPQGFHEIIGSIPFDEPFDAAADFSPIPSPSPTTKPSSKGPKSSVGKPVRRRSRASKKAPTTLLKADASNFRALVQQFTGCRGPTPLLRAYKGPVNLNFKQRSCYPERRQLKPGEAGFQLPEGSDRGGFFPFCAENVVTVAEEEDDRESFVPRVDENPRTDALTYDIFELDKFCGEEVWGPEDYAAEVPGAMDHEFWGC